MAAAMIKNNRLQLILIVLLSPILAHVLPASNLVGAAETSAASSQPLWSYQVKPNNNYANAPGGGGVSGGGPQVSHFAASTGPSSIFDAFNGLSQRQGALTGSPFLSILPIILIAAGGMLLLLPFLTMMMASPFGPGGPFGGGGGGGYGGNGFGFPQVAALGKKRSLADQSFGQRGGGGLVDLIEHVSSTIDELSRKYQHPTANSNNKRAKAMGQQATTTTGSTSTSSTASANEQSAQMNPPTNHRLSSPTPATGSNNEEPNLTGNSGGNNNSLGSSSNAAGM